MSEHATTQLSVTVGPELFTFSDFDDWCDTAKRKFRKSGYAGRADWTLCVDTKGRICRCGKEFMRARDEGAFPVRVFVAVLED